MNEGCVPQSLNADAFLPNALRKHLGLLDNERRYARDCYALSAMLASKTELTLIAGRISADGDPLLPSRLLFSGSDARLAQLVTRFYEAEESAQDLPPLAPAEKDLLSGPPRPQPLSKPITVMSVTSFRDYLRCPYRFYLRHVLGLQTVDDSALEMDAQLFGSLAHCVLCRFGEQQLRSLLHDPQLIRKQLDDFLDQEVRRIFGSTPLASVLVQTEQLRLRLAAFARWQASWVERGWRIEHVERAFDADSVGIDFGQGQRMGVRGRIDRIDFNEREQTWVVFDYKTSERATAPEKSHQEQGIWQDLQLPLYREALLQTGWNAEPLVGYIQLSKGGDNPVGEAIASWSTEDFAEAQQVMRDVAQAVSEQRFWPPREESWSNDEFADICGLSRLREAAGEESEQAPGEDR
jgi:RecB family exonuclease